MIQKFYFWIFVWVKSKHKLKQMHAPHIHWISINDRKGVAIFSSRKTRDSRSSSVCIYVSFSLKMLMRKSKSWHSLQSLIKWYSYFFSFIRKNEFIKIKPWFTLWLPFWSHLILFFWGGRVVVMVVILFLVFGNFYIAVSKSNTLF